MKSFVDEHGSRFVPMKVRTHVELDDGRIFMVTPKGSIKVWPAMVKPTDDPKVWMLWSYAILRFHGEIELVDEEVD